MDKHAIEDLENIRDRFFQQTEAAICEKPDAYAEIKRILIRVTGDVVDIDDIVTRLATLIEKMGDHTFFYSYFYDQIHPKKFGRAKYFRFVCRDLLQQIDAFRTWRKQKRGLEVIK